MGAPWVRLWCSFQRAVSRVDVVFIGLCWLNWDIIMGQSLVLEILEEDAVELSSGSVMGKAHPSLE